MDIFEFALNMELDGEKYYREIAKKVQYADLKTVLEGLAEDEQRHYEIIELAQKQNFTFIEADPALTKMQNIFAENKDFFPVDKESIAKLRDEQFDVYRAALAKEKEGIALYTTLKNKAAGQEEKMICEKLISEEEKHVAVLDHIIDMLNHAKDWVEAAEFNHHDTY